MNPNRNSTFLKQRRQLGHAHPFLLGYARHVRRGDGEDHIVLVQHLVVLEIVQERGGRRLGVAGQKHRGARHDMRRLLCQIVEQHVERYFQMGSLAPSSRAPRCPVTIISPMMPPNNSGAHAPFQQLEQIGAEEGQIDQDEWRHQRGRRFAARPGRWEIGGGRPAIAKPRFRTDRLPRRVRLGYTKLAAPFIPRHGFCK